MFRSPRNTRLLPRHDGLYRFGECLPRLDLDKTDYAPRRACHEIDLSDTRSNAASENTVTLRQQEKTCQDFAATAASLGGLSGYPRAVPSIHSGFALRASARS